MVEILVWTTAIFVVGSVLILERRCLGQMAIVQPLVVCLVAGWIADNTETAIWLGVSLQLFSITQVRHIDWALGGIVSAAALFSAAKLGIPITPGDPGACAVVIVAVAGGFTSRAIDRRYARIDGERQREHSPWAAEHPAMAVESLVHSVVGRWLFIGGIQVLVGTVLAVLALYATKPLVDPGNMGSAIAGAAVPLLAAAATVSSLAGNRLIVWASISAAVSWVIFL